MIKIILSVLKLSSKDKRPPIYTLLLGRDEWKMRETCIKVNRNTKNNDRYNYLTSPTYISEGKGEVLPVL
jgi:hypothetical protein